MIKLNKEYEYTYSVTVETVFKDKKQDNMTVFINLFFINIWLEVVLSMQKQKKLNRTM